MARSLRPAELRAVSDPAALRFRSAVDPPPLEGTIGQEAHLFASAVHVPPLLRAVACPSYRATTSSAPWLASTRRSTRRTSTYTRRPGVAVGRGSFGYIIYVRPDDYERAAAALGV